MIIKLVVDMDGPSQHLCLQSVDECKAGTRQGQISTDLVSVEVGDQAICSLLTRGFSLGGTEFAYLPSSEEIVTALTSWKQPG